MKKYEGYLGELEKLVDNDIITAEHPYYNLYMYIKGIYREFIIKKNIEQITIKEIERIKNIFFREAREDNDDLDLTMLPFLRSAYEKIITKDYSQIEALINLLEPERLNNFINQIYDELTTKKELENNKIQIEKSHEKLMEDCKASLRGLKYKNQQFVDETTEEINAEIITEFLKILTDNDIRTINIIQKEEEKRIKSTIKCHEISEIIKNNEYIVNRYISKIINKKVEELDKEIFRILNIEKKLYSSLLSENLIEIENNKEVLNITIDKLRETKITGDLFNLLNIRCRLILIKDEVFIENIDIRLEEKDINTIEQIIEQNYLEGIEPRYIKEKIKQIQNEFKKIKEAEYNEESQKLAYIMHNQEVYKTTTLKKLEQENENNIYALYLPIIPGTISRGNAVYIVSVLKKIEEDQTEIYDFLSNESVKELPPHEENIMKNKIKEYLNKYIEQETKRLSENKTTPKQLKLIQEGDVNNGKSI